MTAQLPDGFAVALVPRVRRLDGGAALLGGSPLRLLRLRPAARDLLAEQPLRVRDARSARLARQLLDAGVAHPRLEPALSTVDVTVVIPVRDNPAGVERLLQTLSWPERVVVVDDGSAEPLALRRVTEGHGAHLVRHAHSCGPAAARNTGLAHVRTPFVAFLDSDVVPTPGWLPPLRAHMSDPAVALAAPRITALRSTAPRIAGQHGGAGWIDRYERDRSSLDLGPRQAGVVPLSPVAYVPSAALLLRVAAVAGQCFDESMSVAEDVDLCWRLHAQGWRLRYEPAATVAHQHRSSPGTWLARKAVYGTGAAPLAARHPGRVPPLVLAPWTAAVSALVVSSLPGRLPLAAAIAGTAVLRTSRTVHGLEHPIGVATFLAARGLLASGTQLATAACRSYWPVAAVLAAVSPRARRMLVAAAVLEGASDWIRHRRRTGLDPVRYIAAKRLDDAAYGAGLWWGAVRARSGAALRPSLAR